MEEMGNPFIHDSLVLDTRDLADLAVINRHSLEKTGQEQHDTFVTEY